MRWFVKYIVRPKWVVFQFADSGPDEYELGLQICGTVVSLYKGDTLFPTNPKNIRDPGKREFGESLHPL
jgi:hypothetical protein